MKKKRKSVSYAKWGYVFILPFFITYLIFSLIPLVDTVRFSFYEYYRSGIKQIGPNFVGLANYAELLKSDMVTYGKNTLILWIIGFIPQIVVALVLANWFTDARLKIHKLQFFKVVIYLKPDHGICICTFVLYTVLEQWSCELNPAVYGSNQQAYRLYGKCIWNQIAHRLHELPYVVR